MVEDKRTRHTKKRIRQAMLECLNSTSLDKITVMQLCETADINRSTFYAHYPNPIALYKVLEQSMSEGMSLHFQSLKSRSISYMDFLCHFLRYCKDERDLFLALYLTDSVSLKADFVELIERYGFLADTVPQNERTYIFVYYISGVFSVIARWLREDQERSIDEMAKLVYRLTHAPRDQQSS